MEKIRNRKEKRAPDDQQKRATIDHNPPSSPSKDIYKQFVKYKQEKKWSTALLIVTFIALLTRTWNIHNPDQVVPLRKVCVVSLYFRASNVHNVSVHRIHIYLKFLSLKRNYSHYLERKYYFDVHPPLGKMLLALTGYFLNYDGHFKFDSIGDSYIKNNVPYIGMRLVPAIFGALIVPLCFLIMKEMKVSLASSLFCAVLLTFDNSLITQSRLILLDSMLILFCLLTIYTYIRFYKQRYAPFSYDWWFWLSMTGLAIALAMGVKMVGLFTVITIGISVIIQLWDILDIRKGYSLRYFAKHFAARALCLIVLPIILYLSFFYIHFAVLNQSGTGDSFMTPLFQMQLKNSPLTLDSVPVFYGGNVTIKHKKTSMFLHSHVDKYPLIYEDQRVSSEGQQVTSYPHSDQNNLFQIVPVESEFYPIPVYEPTDNEIQMNARYLKNGDLVRFLHVMTNTYLVTHDVASPLTTTQMEVTTLDPMKAAKRYNETVWKIRSTNVENGEKLLTKRHHFRIENVVHKVGIWTGAGVLPKWGFGQNEVNGNKNLKDKGSIWYFNDVEHERIINGTEVGQDKIVNVPESMNFFSKFFELQHLMISYNSGLTKPHPYSSGPLSWPFLIRGISFWETKTTLQQIYLLGNPFVWVCALIGIMLYAALFVIDRLFLRRGVDEFGPSVRKWWDRSLGFMFLAWIMHWAPFFLMGRMLFLHHYLPSFIFSCFVLTLVLEFLGRVSTEPAVLKGMAKGKSDDWLTTDGSWGYWLVLTCLSGICFVMFIYFAPFTYGTSFGAKENIIARQWISSWDFQHTG